MRRLLILLLALAPGWAALRLLAGTATISPWQMRDAGLLAALAVAPAAWAALGGYSGGAAATATWPNLSRTLFGAGAITALVGAALQRLGPPAVSRYGWIVWGVGLALLLVGAFRRGSVTRYAAPAFRWERDARGRFVRRPMDGANAGDLPLVLGARAFWIGAAALLLVGAALRIWLTRGLPPLCQGSECALVLALAEGNTPTSLLLVPLARLIGLFADDALFALRLATALVSAAGLAAVGGALLRWTSPAGALAGLATAAVGLPFVQPLSDPWIELPLLIALVAWGIAAGFAEGGARPWALCGVALGLLAVVAPDLSAAWLIWLVVLLALVALHRNWRDLGVLAGGTLAAASLSAARLEDLLLPLRAAQGFDLWLRQGAELLGAVAGVTPPWLGAIVLLGVGTALRLRRRGAALLGGAAALLLVLLRSDLAALGMERALLPAAGFAAVLAALGIDQLLRAGARAWGSTRARPAPLLATAIALVALLGLPSLWRFSQEVAGAASSVNDDLALAAAAFLSSTGELEGEAAPLILLPSTLIEAPAVRLAAGARIDEGSVRGINLLADLPLAETPPGGAVFLLSSADLPALEELRRLYPQGQSSLVAAEGEGLLASYTVDGAALFDSLGLAQFVYPGSEWGSADEAELSIGVGPTSFSWGVAPPRDAPFSVEWSGALVVRNAGEHTFAVQAAPDALFSLQLDGRLLLDSSAALTEHSEHLPAGLYSVQMRYRSGDTPGDLALLWRPPGQDALQPIPREVLHNPALPPIGLIGSYTAGAAWNGEPLAERKDRLIAADPTLPLPWGVLWQGQIAAPRAGEYLIGLVTNGTAFLDIDGERVASQIPGGEGVAEGIAPLPAEGAIYLTQGWHSITIRFAATEPNPEFKLYWQPPGLGPSALPATFLTSGGGALSPLPPLDAPDARYGTEGFALTADVSFWNPQTRIPPRALSPLPFERVSAVGSCGSGVDQLSAPHGIAFDAERGLLYVADSGNRRVVAYALAGTQLASPQIVPLEGIEELVDVAVTPQGVLWALDTAAPRLLRYDPLTGESETVALAAGFYRPRGLATDAFGLLYVADTGGGRVAVVAEDGTLSAEFGGQGTPLGRGQPVDVAATGRSIWAIAAEDGRLWRLDTLGSLTAILPTNTIDGPQLAAVPDHPELGFFLSDPARRQVLYLGSDGQPLGALGDSGAFELPTGVAALSVAASETPGADETNPTAPILLAVSDSAACSVTLWQARADLLPPTVLPGDVSG